MATLIGNKKMADQKKNQMTFRELAVTTYAMVAALIMFGLVAYIPYFALGEVTGWWEVIPLTATISDLLSAIIWPQRL